MIGRRLPDVPVTPTSPPSENLVPLLSQQQPQQPYSNLVDVAEEEQASAGSGNLMGGAKLTPDERATVQAAKEFFSQFDWQSEENASKEEYSGYVQYEDQATGKKGPRPGSSSSSGSSSGDDGLNFQATSYGPLVENLYAQPAKLKAKNADDPFLTESRARGEVEMEKLIEVSTEEDIESIQLGASNASSNGLSFNQSEGTSGTPDAFAGVVFDPWGTFSPPDENGDTAGSGELNIDEMFGLGVSDSAKTNTTVNPNSAPAGSGPETSTTQNTSPNLDTFDPFGSTQTTNMSSYNPFSTNLSASFSGTVPSNGNTGMKGSSNNCSSSSSNISQAQAKQSGGMTNDPFGMLGDASLHAPMNITSTASPESPVHSTGLAANAPAGLGSHMHSEPFVDFGSFLTPSPASTGPTSTRKLSSPVPQQFANVGQSQQPAGGVYGRSNLAPSQPPRVSLSHPNLSLASQNQPMQPNSGIGRGGATSGWNSSSSYGLGGSLSHNSSVRRSPSPVAGSKFTENVSLTDNTSASFDPFQQFNIKSMSGQPQGSSNSQGQGTSMRNGTSHPSAPRATQTNSSGLPPTGNSYRPYYMQSQAGQPGAGGQRTNGVGTSRSNGAVPGKQGGGGAASNPKTSSVFHHRPQSPNYNPSYGGGSKTGEKICSVS